ncbi:hypothetical protein [Desulforamulus aeronauticus]|uniref:Uncharacterized protein n=1 Tax=Desulforamulus aeronauticus DSM 10349 TaxID=1121421 RepID=A0A1M6S4W9_9FIRM|nr:hypothetical protein [Desulforamulus aeronauticus]SHK39721.1 hypothetical protein SAMN02745123_01726 [Desulforamulus aeronauticus DSM 10349]
MKVKRMMVALLLVVMSLTVIGCSGSGGTEAAPKEAQEAKETSNESQKITIPEEKPAFIGKVKEIVGNEVTVYKAEVNQNQGPSQENQAREVQPQERPAKDSSADQAQTPTPTQGDQGARPGNGGFRMNFTEETETFMIPVGVPIVTMQGGRGSQEATVVQLTQIKKDTVLRIWKTDDEVSFVQVTGGSSQRSNRETTGNNRAGNGPQGGMGGPPPGM